MKNWKMPVVTAMFALAIAAPASFAGDSDMSGARHRVCNSAGNDCHWVKGDRDNNATDDNGDQYRNRNSDDYRNQNGDENRDQYQNDHRYDRDRCKRNDADENPAACNNSDDDNNPQ